MKNNELRKNLLIKRKNGYDCVTAKESIACEEYAEGYKASGQEQDGARRAIASEVMAKVRGYVPYGRACL